MNALFVAIQVTVSSTVIVRVNQNEDSLPGTRARRVRLYCQPWTPART
jgi:hypothetical protein